MAASVARISLICIWLETILYGVNCVLYSGCMFVLFNLRRPLNRSTSRQIPSRTILFGCTFLFTTATVHVVLSFIQLLFAFTDTETTSTITFTNIYLTSNQFILPNMIIYIFNSSAQFLLLIWKLYVVAGHTWKPCIIPLVILAAGACCSLFDASLLGKEGVALHYLTRAISLAAWTIGFCLNAGLSAGISYFLWVAQRHTDGLRDKDSNIHKTAILLVIESGALITSFELVMMVLAYVGNVTSIIATSVVIQIATASPLLIVVRVGMAASRTHTSRRPSTTGNSRPRFRPPVTVNVHIDTVRSTEGSNTCPSPIQLSVRSKQENLHGSSEA